MRRFKFQCGHKPGVVWAADYENLTLPIQLTLLLSFTLCISFAVVTVYEVSHLLYTPKEFPWGILLCKGAGTDFSRLNSAQFWNSIQVSQERIDLYISPFFSMAHLSREMWYLKALLGKFSQISYFGRVFQWDMISLSNWNHMSHPPKAWNKNLLHLCKIHRTNNSHNPMSLPTKLMNYFDRRTEYFINLSNLTPLLSTV